LHLGQPIDNVPVSVTDHGPVGKNPDGVAVGVEVADFRSKGRGTSQRRVQQAITGRKIIWMNKLRGVPPDQFLLGATE
jgi:hypothetical protein